MVMNLKINKKEEERGKREGEITVAAPTAF